MKKLFLTSVATVCLSVFSIAQATLPLSWDFSTTILPTGFTSSGTFGYYPAAGSPAPSAKFQATSDLLTISFSSAPGNVTYDIVGNAFSAGTFLVEESFDSVAWTTLHTYTAPPSTYTTMTDTPSVLSRYIRFNYSNKVTGNIGLDNVSIDLASATIICFPAPDGIDSTSGWSYKDYIIPSGYRIDSVFMDAIRPGFVPEDWVYVFESCAGVTVYDNAIGTYPWIYSMDSVSEYGRWINLISFNYTSVGMARVSLPCNAGAIWNQLCLAISPQITTGIIHESEKNDFGIYPNPATEFIYLKNVKSNATAEIINTLGQKVKSVQNVSTTIDIAELPKGFYFLKIIEQNSSSVRTAKFIKR